MTKFRTEFDMQIDVQFVDPEKSKAFFIDGDWKNSFWEFEELNEVAADIAHSFNLEDSQWNPRFKKICKFIEGYGTFVKEGDVYITTNLGTEEAGEIRILEAQELQPVSTVTV